MSGPVLVGVNLILIVLFLHLQGYRLGAGSPVAAGYMGGARGGGMGGAFGFGSLIFILREGRAV